jgi:hypothetical protein
MPREHERRFPIQGETVRSSDQDGGSISNRREAGWIPWGVAEEAYKVYSRRYGKDQSLERLAQRGGFGWSELVWLLRDGKTSDFKAIPWGEPKP